MNSAQQPVLVWLAVTLVVAFSAAVAVAISYRRWKRGWLSSEVERRLALSQPKPSRAHRSVYGATSRVKSLPLVGMERLDRIVQYFRKGFLSELADWRSPSIASFSVLAATVTGLFLLARWPQVPDRLPSPGEVFTAFVSAISDEDGKVSGLITGAFGALAVVVIALVVFVAESIRDDADKERKRVLLRLSLLWPLGLLATLVPIGFLWTTTSPIVIALVLMMAALTIYAFARLITNLLNPVLQEKQRVAFLEGRVRNIVRQSARERIANNVLREAIGPAKQLAMFDLTISRSWLDAEAQSLVFVDAPKNGRLVDIHLEELKKLGDRIDWVARSHFSFSLVDSGPTTSDTAAEGEPAPKPYPLKKAYIVKRFGEEVPETSLFHADARSLLAVPQELARRPDAMADISASLSHIFRFSTEEASSTIFRRELQATRDELVSAISAQAVSKVDELRALYLKIAEQFLETLVELGGGYSAEQARQERSAFSGEWDEVGWLRTDLRELTAVALGATNTTIAGKVGYLPFAIATRAVHARDHLLFQQFLGFAIYEYHTAKDITDATMRSYILERTWRWSKEVAEFFVERLVTEKKSSTADVENGLEFALHVIRTFQDLLKAAVDGRDWPYFATVFDELQGLFEGVSRDIDNWIVAEALSLGRGAKSLPELRQASSDLDKAKAQLRSKNEIASAKGAIILALSGRLASAVFSGDESAKASLEVATASLNLDLEKLVALFAYASDSDSSDKWGWSWWDLPSDGKVHTIDTQSAISRVFVKVLLAALVRDKAISRLPRDQHLAEMAREEASHSLVKLLDDVESDVEKWGRLLLPQELAEVPRLRALLVQLRKDEIAAEIRRTQLAALDADRVADFGSKVVSSHRSSARLRTILEAIGVDTERGTSAKRNTYLGYNQIDDKRAFIRQERTSFVGWGKSFGEGLARSEDGAVLEEIVSQIPRQTLSEEPVVGQILSVLASSEFTDPVALVALGFRREYYDLSSDSAFVGRANVDRKLSPLASHPAFLGEIRHHPRTVPVLSVRGAWPREHDIVIVADWKALLKWVQYDPASNEVEATKVRGDILIDVVDLNADDQRRRAVIRSEPKWLESISDKESYLRERVVIRILESFEIRLLNRAAGVALEAEPQIRRPSVSS